MAEITRLKDVQADVRKLIDIMEQRHQEYLQQRSTDLQRMDRLELTLSSLQLAASTGGSDTNKLGSSSFQVRNTKLDFPEFDGIEVLQWIFKADQFFDYYKTPDEQRLTIAAVHMEKEAVPWFQMKSRMNPFQSWVYPCSGTRIWAITF